MTPQRLLVVAVVLLAGLAAAFFFLLGEDAAGGGPAAALGGPGQSARTTLVEKDGEAARLSRVETQETARAVRDEVASASAAPAREIDVVVTSPLGAPADPGLSVVVVEASALEDDSPAEVLQRLREERGAGGTIARAVVGADGRARLGLPAGTEELRLLLDGRFLYLSEPRPLESEETSALLEPMLGACLVVRPVAPVGDAPVGKITLTGGDMSGRSRGDAWFAVGQELDGGELVYRGLDTDNTWFLSGKLERHFTWGRMGLELEPGLEKVVDLELLPGASVSGVVVDAAGEPVADVTVRPAMGAANWMGGGGNRPEATTDADGAFELFALSPGEKVLEARLDGWRPAESDEFELAEGQHLDGLRIVLERGESLAGVVAFPDGKPAEGAEVIVESITQRQGWGGFGGARRRKAGAATCDEAGRFAVTGLAQGKVSVRASAPAPGAAEDDEDAPQWTASLDDVAAGSQGLTLTLAGPETFTGRVVDDLGEPVTAFRIEAESSEGDDPGGEQSFENDEGRFTFARVGTGTWSLEVSAEGHVQEEAPEITLPGAAELEIVLLRAARVSGRVLGAGGAPVAGARVRADDGSSGGNPWMGMRGPRVDTDSEGAFEFEELAPGALSFVAQAEGWADSEPLGIEIGPGEQLEDAVLTLRVGGRIEGVVSTPEGEPMAGQRVTWGENSMGFGSRGETRADGAGRFAFDAVTPGEWAVSAVPTMEEMGERMRGNRDQGAWIEMMGQVVTETVDVEDGELVEVFLGGEPRRPVSVVGVVTQAGEAVAGARVFAVSEGSAIFQGMKTTETASDGTYELVVDRPGPYVISAQMDRAGIEQLVDVPRTDETRVDLLIPMGGIEGRVKLASGEPADGVRVSVQREDGMGRVRWAGGQATTDSDGNYSIESLEEGVYTVRANVSGWGGGADQDWGSATLSGIEVEEDALTSGVDFRLEAAGSVTGIVTGSDGAPLADAGVFFRDASGRLVTSVSSTTTGPSGRFSQDGLAPGEYTLSVRAVGQAANDVETVRVLSDEKTEVRLSVESGVMALVQLEDPEGNASRLRVEVFDGDDREVGGLITAAQLRTLFNRGSSSFEQRVGPLPPGRYTVRATTPEGKVVEKRVTLRARDEEKVVRLVLD